MGGISRKAVMPLRLEPSGQRRSGIDQGRASLPRRHAGREAPGHGNRRSCPAFTTITHPAWSRFSVARRRSRQRHHPTPLRLVPNTKGIAASPRQGNHNRPWASWHQDDTPTRRTPPLGRCLPVPVRSGVEAFAAGNDAANTLQSSAPSPRERLPAPAQDGIPAWSALISAAHGYGGLGSGGMVTPGNAGLSPPPRRGQEPGELGHVAPSSREAGMSKPRGRPASLARSCSVLTIALILPFAIGVDPEYFID